MKKLFKDLDKNYQLLLVTLPMSVSVTRNPDDETDKQFIETRDRFLTLSEIIQEKLSSLETSEKIKQISQYFNLELLQMADISRAVRGYYFGELKLEDMPAVLAREIGIDLNKAQEIANQVIQKIIKDDSYIKKTELINLPLSQALQKFPRLGEQLVTSSPIKLKIFPDPVRPSVKNWIAEYHSVLGAGSHGTMERGNFLYHSENAKRLNFGERQKLAVVLKSLDENEAVAVDAEKQEIVFGELSASSFQLSEKNANKIPEARSYKPEANRDFRFSSPQRLQSEPPQPKSYQHFDPYHIDPVGYPEDKPKPEPPKPPQPPALPRPEPRVEGNIVDLRNN